MELTPSLAIIDFENLTKVPVVVWIGSGVAESLASDRSGVPGLSLVPRERVMKTRADLGAAGHAPGLAQIRQVEVYEGALSFPRSYQ